MVEKIKRDVDRQLLVLKIKKVQFYTSSDNWTFTVSFETGK